MERRSRYASHASNDIGETVYLLSSGQQAFAAISALCYANRLHVRYKQIVAHKVHNEPVREMCILYGSLECSVQRSWLS